MEALHPYAPAGLEIPGYVPQSRPRETILALFFLFFAAPLMGLTWLLSGRTRANLKLSDRLCMVWFAMSGPIHLVIEGYFALNRNFGQDTTGNLLADVWKEYSKCDSRYVTREAFVVTMETFTAFVEGPACFLIVYLLAIDHPKKWVWMILTCFGQLYGDILYFATEWHGGFTHGREELIYFWFYFVIVNSVWIIFPVLVIWYSWNSVNKLLMEGRSRPHVDAINGHSKTH